MRAGRASVSNEPQHRRDRPRVLASAGQVRCGKDRKRASRIRALCTWPLLSLQLAVLGSGRDVDKGGHAVSALRPPATAGI